MAASSAPPRSPVSHAPAAGSFAQVTTSQKLFAYLCAVFVSCLILGDVIGGKIITTPAGPISVGIIPFPVTFLLTDIVNDFYGRKGARFLTLCGFFMALLAWVLLQGTTLLSVDPTSTYLTQAEYQKVFAGSAQLFVASMLAYVVGQLLDIGVFQYWKALTESRHLWLRATGSTIVSQAVDTILVNVVFGRVTAGWTYGFIVAKVEREYVIKFLVAVALTPAIYALHGIIVRWLRIEPEPAQRRAR